MSRSRTRFKIQLGSFEQEYILCETTAPKDYDGFGTITLHEGSESECFRRRWVLVRTEHEEWQLGRYGSGMHSVTPFDSGPNSPTLAKYERWITDELYKKLIGAKQ